MSDSYTETETVGWFSQLKDSIKGVLTGFIMVLIAFPLLFGNEWNSASMADALEEGRGAAISVTSEKVDKANDGKLVHTTGETKVDGDLEDEKFGVKAEGAIKLIRSTKIFQWKETTKTETKKKVGGKKEKKKTYTYKKEWVDKPIDSSSFKVKKKHGNSDDKFVEGQSWNAKKVDMGAFALSDGLISSISGGKPLAVTKKQAKALKDSFGKVKIDGGAFYLGDPDDPEIGDVKISFEVVEAGEVSVLAKQDGSKLTSYETSNGRDITQLSMGKKTMDEMFDAAESSNAMLAWILRFIGLFMIFGGVSLIFKPLVVVADVIPFVGNMLGFGVSVFAGLTTIACGFPTIALAWLLFNPWPWGILACLCSLVGIGGLVGVAIAVKKKKGGGEAAAAA